MARNDLSRGTRVALGPVFTSGGLAWLTFGGASASGAGAHAPVSSAIGRFAFGIGALLLDAGAAWYWVVALRVARRRS